VKIKMTSKLTSITIATLLSVFICSATIADTCNIEKGFISVNESSSKEIAPNLAEISIAIESSDSSVKKASEMNKIAANKVYSVLKSMLGNNDYLKTTNYTVIPQYIYTKDNKKILDKYLVSNTVVVKTKNLDLVSQLIDAAISHGASKIDNLDFSAVDYDSTCNELLADLSKRTYKKANTIAQAINSQVLGIKSINATCNQENTYRPLGRMLMMKAAMNSTEATPIESGKIKVYANMDAAFFVK